MEQLETVIDDGTHFSYPLFFGAKRPNNTLSGELESRRNCYFEKVGQ